MIDVKFLNVKCNGMSVGKLAETPKGLVAFEYDNSWLLNGFSISPFSLPLKRGVFVPRSWELFEGMFGIFADSLPDVWGRLLVDRMLVKKGFSPRAVTMLQRLAIVGAGGMGALTYEPELLLESAAEPRDFDVLSLECGKILRNEYSDDLDALFKLGGSSGGARPKILTEIDGDDWIIKFPSSYDGLTAGADEYQCSVAAKKCGIEMPETRLFASNICSGYFGVKRFDIHKNGNSQRRIHTASVSALLESSHRIPSLDYNDLMKLTMVLTRSFGEVEKMFRLMCFNVFAHNRDDHAKNFSFIFNEQERGWHLSPAYDLTCSNSVGGEHATTVDGEGRNPDISNIMSSAHKIGMNERKAKTIALEIMEIAEFLLEVIGR